MRDGQCILQCAQSTQEEQQRDAHFTICMLSTNHDYEIKGYHSKSDYMHYY